MFISSMYFETIEDFMNLEISVKRVRGNIDKFHYNPISLTSTIQLLFIHLQTLYLYDLHSPLFLEEEKIIKRLHVKPIIYEKYEKLSAEKRELITFNSVDYKSSSDTKTRNTNHIMSIPKEVNEISSYCFADSVCRNVIIPTTVTRIRKRCFFNCITLQQIEIPSTVLHLEDETFLNCKKLQSITLSSTLKSIEKKCFKN